MTGRRAIVAGVDSPEPRFGPFDAIKWCEGLFSTRIDRRRVEVHELLAHKAVRTIMAIGETKGKELNKLRRPIPGIVQVRENVVQVCWGG